MIKVDKGKVRLMGETEILIAEGVVFLAGLQHLFRRETRKRCR